VNRTSKVILWSFLLLFIIAPFTKATQILYRSPQQLGQQSELVVHGRVVGSESQWNDKRTKIFTTTRIAVESTFKGATAPTVEIIQLGGTVGSVKVTVSGALRWVPGEEVVLFLEPYAQGKYQVSGFSQGKFNVERDPDTGKAFIRRPALEGVQVLGAPSSDEMARTSKFENIPLETFVNRALGNEKKGGSQ
jgi:hypothetical protein